MPLNRIDGNLYVAGQLTADAFDPPNNSVGDNAMNAGNPIGVDKTRHLHTRVHGQMDGGSVYDEIRCIHVALVAGSVEQFQAGLRVPITGDSTMTIDLHKNGVSILSDIIDLDNTFTAYQQVVAGIDPSKQDYASGDVFEIVIIVTDNTGTPGEGLFAIATFDEGAF